MRKPKFRSVFMLTVTFMVTLNTTSAFAQWHTYDQAIMGTAIRVELWHADSQKAVEASNQVFAEMRRIDRLMSPFIADSELSAINTNASKEPVKVSPELFQLIKTSKRISDMSGGIFDISFSSVGYLYDYRAGKKPTDQQITQLIGNINYHAIKLDETTSSVTLEHQGMKLDLGGIGKGYAVDRSIEILRNLKIQHAIVTAGGDSGVLGDHRGRDWMVGIQAPRNKTIVATAIPLTDAAISTSGDYERFFIEDGVRFHHIINPKTGDSARLVQSASVIGPEATITDALSTTVFILGVKRGIELIETLPQYDVIFIDQHSKLHFSSGLQPAIAPDVPAN